MSDAQDELNTVRLANLSEDVKDILCRNNFLSHFGGSDPDGDERGGTIVPYTKFDNGDTRGFMGYLEKNLFGNPSLSELPDGLSKKIQESILEIFMNAQTHGKCKSIFSCGQLFPQKNRLDFTIVNTGTTIKQNVLDFTGDRSLDSIQAIEWAVQESNTTRKDKIPGGLGLSTLMSFLELNNGKIQVVSDDGYWAKISNRHRWEKFSQPFGGTIVNIEFDIDNTKCYEQSPEESSEIIF